MPLATERNPTKQKLSNKILLAFSYSNFFNVFRWTMQSDHRVKDNLSTIQTAGHDEQGCDTGLWHLGKNQNLAFNIHTFLTVAKLCNF